MSRLLWPYCITLSYGKYKAALYVCIGVQHNNTNIYNICLPYICLPLTIAFQCSFAIWDIFSTERCLSNTASASSSHLVWATLLLTTILHTLHVIRRLELNAARYAICID